MSIKKIIRKAGYTVAALVAIVFIAGLILAFLPTKLKTNHIGISAEQAAVLRQRYSGAHDQFTTTDGETLFLWRWNPDTLVDAKKDIAVLIFHGITAYGGAYTMAGVPISSGDIQHLVWIIGDMAYRAETEGTLQA